MLRTLFCLSGVLLAATLAAQESDMRSAEQMMIDAHKARSAWDKNFPGFKADLTATMDNNVIKGSLNVPADGKVQLKLPEGDVAMWAKEQFDSIVSHRFPTLRDSYDVSFADKEVNHPLGRLISFKGNRHNFYRIHGNVITEVHRQFPTSKFIISVTETARNKDGQLLPQHFNVSYWDPKTNDLVSNEDYQEEWVRVGDYDLPRRRLYIKTGNDKRSVGELRLSNHELLTK